MLIHDSCQSAIQSCLDSRTFAIARLYNNEKTMSIHIHDCYEIYFSISGGQQFLIDNRVYEFAPGDIFSSTSLRAATSPRWTPPPTSGWWYPSTPTISGSSPPPRPI